MVLFRRKKGLQNNDDVENGDPELEQKQREGEESMRKLPARPALQIAIDFDSVTF